MRPLAALLGIVLGSGVAFFAGLALTLVVFLFLPEHRDRLSGEFAPLLRATGWAAVLTAIAAAAFIGELRSRQWRRLAQGLLAAVLLGLVWTYWPW